MIYGSVKKRFMLLATLLLSCALFATEVRVAFFPLPGFFSTNEQGEKEGYGVEVLDKISEVSDLTFRYIDAGAWEDVGKMIRNHEADIFMPVTPPSTPSSRYKYTKDSIINSFYAIMTKKGRQDLLYEDESRMGTLTIAMSKSLYAKEDLGDSIKAAGIKEENITFVDSFEEGWNLVLWNKVDAVLSNVMDFDNSSMKMLERFLRVPNHIAGRLDDPLVTEIDNAIAKIKLNFPSFFNDIYAKYFPYLYYIPLTAKETRYLQEKGSLRFALTDGQGYLTRKENGVFVGILPRIAKRVCSILDVDYEPVEVSADQNPIGQRDDYDVITGCANDYLWAKQSNALLSSPYFTVEYCAVTKKHQEIDPDTCTVAAIPGFYYTEHYVRSSFRPEQIVLYHSFEQCLEAVAKGEVDMTVINNYVAEYYLSLYQYSELSEKLIGFHHSISYGIDENNPLLVSIMNKAFSAISEQEIDGIILEETALVPEQEFWQTFFYRDTVQKVILFVMLALLLVLTIFLIIFSRALKKQNIEMAKVHQAKTDFFSNLSHDMRTPMNGILGFTSLAQDEDDITKIKEDLAKIKDSGDYMLHLINDTLDVQKMESGNFHLEPVAVSAPGILLNVIDIMQVTAKRKDVAFVVENHVNLEGYIKADPIRVKQIFINLLNNAIKFTPAGGTVKFIIDKEAQEGNTYLLRFTIQDNGIGMSEHFLKNGIFRPFSQEQNDMTGNFVGSGLGLSIVKRLVTIMDGNIHVESKLGEGTTFTVFLQFERVEKPEEKPQEEKLGVAHKALLTGKRILLAEDHPLNAEITTRMLDKVGCIVTLAEDGQKAVDLFAASKPFSIDAILMDIRMPVMDGLEATRAIRALPRHDAQNVPIIAMTANAYKEDREACFAAGMTDYLSKPIDRDKLYETLEEHTK